MANFSKLNIGDRVASSGLRRFRKLSVEQLPSPYGVSLDGDYLSWGDYSCFATSFDILVDGVVKATVSAPTNSFDLSTLGLASGTYSISVVSKADGYLDSDPSEAVSYEVGGGSLGTFTYAQTTAWYSQPIIRQFRLGMTWADFIASEYNTIQTDKNSNGTFGVKGQFINQNGLVKFSGTDLNTANALTIPVLNNSYSSVAITDVIYGGTYKSVNNSSGGGAN